ncbi:MAG: hypothetical protein ACOCQM_05975 [Natronomonas sp.]
MTRAVDQTPSGRCIALTDLSAIGGAVLRVVLAVGVGFGLLATLGWRLAVPCRE